MEHSFNVFMIIPSIGKQSFQFLDVGYRVNPIRNRLHPESSIKISSNTHMVGITGQLANVIDMVNPFIQGNFRFWIIILPI